MWTTPVYDRTLSDVMEVKNNPLSSNTKGAFNCSDLNRIENNIEYVANLFEQLYKFNPVTETKTNWNITDIPTLTQINRIRNNIIHLKQTIDIDGWENIEFTKTMNYERLNIIEKNLLLIKEKLEYFQEHGTPIIGNNVLDSVLESPFTQ